MTWTGHAAPDRHAKTYTKAQLAALTKVTADLIEQLAMSGLIEPRGDLYGFRNLAAARQISSLLASGVTLSTIRRSLADIRKWLPDAGLANLWFCARSTLPRLKAETASEASIFRTRA